MGKFKIGVIGANRRGKIVKYLPESAEVVAAADIDPSALEQFSDNVFKTEDYKELLKRKEVAAVFITTRDIFHEEMAVAALEAGKAVYLEKPMAITVEGCDRILETACRTGSRLFLGHNMRYMPFVLKMKEIIDSGIIGDIQAVWCRHFISYGNCYFRHWCSERKNCNGLLLQKGAHDIDVIHWLAGGYTTRVIGMGRLSVFAKCKRRAPEAPIDRTTAWKESTWPPPEMTDLSPVINVEDHNMVMLQLDNGVQASYTQCFYTPDAERNYTFIGTRGRMENIGDQGECRIHVWTQRGSRQSPDIIYHLKPVEGSHGGADPEIVKAFIEFARNGVIPATSPVAARNAVAAGVLGHESMRHNNEPKTVPPLSSHIIEYFIPMSDQS
ncbi:MAG: Gfo/Idh/MocA family oxidoreductase [Victivallales bacterium]|nr:Gfo/Idh/MocA family oxidoreductase [Victivallales bacterium]